MAKKKKGKVIQMLTPENYIRQKARSLPVFECWLNNDWNETGLANILVGRKHSNGNITAGLYLVDLKCLGVKDSTYWFNIPEFEFREIIERASGMMYMESVPYTLVHNIIFAGLEFADDFGFKPYKEFTSVAQYILEEDTDDIEMMEIDCGMNGKPAYIRGPLENDVESARIIAQLERSAGPGNYIFIDEINKWGDLEDDEEEMDFEDEDFDYTPSDTTFQFKIELKGVSDPKVWRRLILPSDYTFMDLHTAIQIAFGWEDEHLFMFSPKGFGSNPQITEMFEDDMDDWGEEKLDADELILSDIFTTEKQKYTYIYDFGDSWVHMITLEKILEKSTLYPVCLDGNGKCPPEDCGGIGGFYQMKEVLADKKHPEYGEYMEWLGLEDDEIWDAEEFNMDEINIELEDIYA